MTGVQTLEKTVAPVRSDVGSVDEPARVVAAITRRLSEGDLEGARSGLLDWCGTLIWRKPDNDDVVSVALLLVDAVAELMAAQRGPAAADQPSAVFQATRDEYTFTASTHFSILTAAVLRQRAQLAELTALVDRLSRRLI